jgi:hypothetical protein
MHKRQLELENCEARTSKVDTNYFVTGMFGANWLEKKQFGAQYTRLGLQNLPLDSLAKLYCDFTTRSNEATEKSM